MCETAIVRPMTFTDSHCHVNLSTASGLLERAREGGASAWGFAFVRPS